jgi:uncharacterized protein DUF4396
MKLAALATLHCLTGCAAGEILGMALAAGFGWSNGVSVAVSVILAFAFGYALTFHAVRSVRTALAADTISIATMEIVDNAFILLVPGALAAGLGDALFWWSLLASLAIAFVVTVPVNAWLMARGRGHAVVHRHHAH